MVALLLGSVLAVAGLAYVLWPLLRGVVLAPSVTNAVESPEASAVEALREIEFDQATGKLSAEDYASLRASYTPLALAELRAQDAASSQSTQDATDAAELLIARARSAAAGKVCAVDGPRPEPDAVFCSDCGRFLGAVCLNCGAHVEGERARFCTECGASLAA